MVLIYQYQFVPCQLTARNLADKKKDYPWELCFSWLVFNNYLLVSQMVWNSSVSLKSWLDFYWILTRRKPWEERILTWRLGRKWQLMRRMFRAQWEVSFLIHELFLTKRCPPWSGASTEEKKNLTLSQISVSVRRIRHLNDNHKPRYHDNRKHHVWKVAFTGVYSIFLLCVQKHIV